MSESVAKRWVEEHYPSINPVVKSMLIIAYGAGLDKGLEEAQEIVKETVREVSELFLKGGR